MLTSLVQDKLNSLSVDVGTIGLALLSVLALVMGLRAVLTMLGIRVTVHWSRHHSHTYRMWW